MGLEHPHVPMFIEFATHFAWLKVLEGKKSMDVWILAPPRHWPGGMRGAIESAAPGRLRRLGAACWGPPT